MLDDLGTLLGVWAHPDDETFMTAGLMALARAHGSRVVCVTATRGEHGTDDPDRWPPDRLGQLRERELAQALALLDVREHHWLGFTDGGCAHVHPAAGSGAVREVIDAVRPDTVVTFGPDGLTGHPDHRAVSRWTSAAVESTDHPVRLLHVTVTRDFLRRHAGLNARFGVFYLGEPPGHDPGELSLHLRLDGTALDRKVAAMRAQASQIGPLYDAVGDAAFRAWWGTEALVETHVPTARPVAAA